MNEIGRIKELSLKIDSLKDQLEKSTDQKDKERLIRQIIIYKKLSLSIYQKSKQNYSTNINGLQTSIDKYKRTLEELKSNQRAF